MSSPRVSLEDVKKLLLAADCSRRLRSGQHLGLGKRQPLHVRFEPRQVVREGRVAPESRSLLWTFLRRSHGTSAQVMGSKCGRIGLQAGFVSRLMTSSGSRTSAVRPSIWPWAVPDPGQRRRGGGRRHRRSHCLPHW